MIQWKKRFLKFVQRLPESTATGYVEDYRPGYPRYSALISAHSSFHLFRRFGRLRARLLLLKQDKLSYLEKQLDQIDASEDRDLFLGNYRNDSNTKRHEIVSQIDTALAEYDSLMERNNRALGYETAKNRHVSSLQHWVDGNACIARAETAYLRYGADLATLATTDDRAINQLEAWIEDALIRVGRKFRIGLGQDMSNDPNVHIFPTSLTTRLTRWVILPLITILLLTPIAVCKVLDSMTARIVIILISTIVFLGILSGLTKARTIEMFIAGATYAAVLVVFVGGANVSTN